MEAAKGKGHRAVFTVFVYPARAEGFTVAESTEAVASKGPSFAPNDRSAIESSMAPDDERMGFNLCAEGEKFLPGTSSSGFSPRGYSTTAPTFAAAVNLTNAPASLARHLARTKADKGITVRAVGLSPPLPPPLRCSFLSPRRNIRILRQGARIIRTSINQD